MTLKEIHRRASAMGLQGVSRMRKHTLIRHIQQAEGFTPCFGGKQRVSCVQTDCCWRFDCLRRLDTNLTYSQTQQLSVQP